MQVTNEMIAFGALLVALASFLFARSKSGRQSVADSVRVAAQLDSIQSGVEDIRVEMRSMRDKLSSDSERITACEMRIKAVEKEVFKS